MLRFRSIGDTNTERRPPHVVKDGRREMPWKFGQRPVVAHVWGGVRFTAVGVM